MIKRRSWRSEIKIVAGLCPSPFIRLFPKVQFLKKIGSVNNMFRTLRLKSLHLLNDNFILVMLMQHFHIAFLQNKTQKPQFKRACSKESISSMVCFCESYRRWKLTRKLQKTQRKTHLKIKELTKKFWTVVICILFDLEHMKELQIQG